MTVVVKLGGAAGNARAFALDEVAERRDVVLVHGGSEAIEALGAALGRPAQYYTSPSGAVSRRTTAADLEVVTAALAGKENPAIVAELLRRGVPALGLCGIDGGLVRATRKEAVRAVVDGRTVLLRDDLSGTIEAVSAGLLRLLLGARYVPVVSPPALGEGGEVLNVDADRLAAHIARALPAEALVLLTNVPGLLRDPRDLASRVERVGEADWAVAERFAQGRMRKKVLAAREAREGGVPLVALARSDRERPIAAALRGEGTVFA